MVGIVDAAVGGLVLRAVVVGATRVVSGIVSNVSGGAVVDDVYVSEDAWGTVDEDFPQATKTRSDSARHTPSRIGFCIVVHSFTVVK